MSVWRPAARAAPRSDRIAVRAYVLDETYGPDEMYGKRGVAE